MPLRALLAIYTHPEFYPPTINAAEALAAKGYDVTILCSNHAVQLSNYNLVVQLDVVGDFIPVREVGRRSTWQKIRHWIAFTWRMYELMSKADVVLAYDTIPLLSYRVARWFGARKPKTLWYHNHDVIEPALQRKYSVSWFSARNEPKMFPKLDIFSLPSEERKAHFPMDKLRGEYVFLPNFPSLKRYGSISTEAKANGEWRIIFQGSIGPGHGIEEICQLLPMTHAGKPVKLLLKGFVPPGFQEQINRILSERLATEYVEWGVLHYELLPQLTSTCHLGVAVFQGKDIMNRTLGTASNKIYEYAACGVPVLYHDTPYFNDHLGQYKWALGSSLEANNLEKTIRRAFDQQEELAAAARKDFLERLNFERYFTVVLNDSRL